MKSRALRFLFLVPVASLLGGCASFRQPEPVLLCGGSLIIIDDEEVPCTSTRDPALDAAATPPDGD
jgi:hypothetical protein